MLLRSTIPRIFVISLMAAFWIPAIIINMTYYLPFAPSTRLHIIIPVMAITAAYGLVKVFKKSYIVLLILLIYVVMELYNFYYLMPLQVQQTSNSLMLQLASMESEKSVCIMANNNNNLENIFISDMQILRKLYHVSNIHLFGKDVTEGTIAQCDILTRYSPITDSVYTSLIDQQIKLKTKKILRDRTQQSDIIYYQ